MLIKLIFKLLKLIFLRTSKEESKPKVKPTKKDSDMSEKPKRELLFKNDSQRLKFELVQLKRVNKELYNLLQDLVQYVSTNYNKEVVVTMIYRTQEEQDNIYKGTKRGNREYDNNPWTSPHQYYQAVDIRSRIFTEDEIQQIVEYLNSKYNSSNYYKWTAKCHKVAGGAMHFHIQHVKG